MSKLKFFGTSALLLAGVSAFALSATAEDMKPQEAQTAPQAVEESATTLEASSMEEVLQVLSELEKTTEEKAAKAEKEVLDAVESETKEDSAEIAPKMESEETSDSVETAEQAEPSIEEQLNVTEPAAGIETPEASQEPVANGWGTEEAPAAAQEKGWWNTVTSWFE